MDGDRRRELIFTRELDGTEYPYYGLALLGREIGKMAPPLLVRRTDHDFVDGFRLLRRATVDLIANVCASDGRGCITSIARLQRK